MMLSDASPSFAQSPVGAVLIPLVAGAILAIAGALIKMMLDIASLKQNVSEISRDIIDIKNDKDTMRWSEYRRRSRRKRESRITPDGEE